MTHPSERGRQRARAIDALKAACERLAELHGVDAPEIPTRFARDPIHLPTLQIEAVTRFLEAIESKPKKPSATPKPTTIPASTGLQG